MRARHVHVLGIWKRKMATKQRSLLLALVQLKVSANKAENLTRAKALVTKAAENGAKLVSLPECFNSPYGTQYFAEYAETIPGETTNFLSKIAKELKIHLIGGSIPESHDGKLYNTSTVFGPDGTMLGEFRKLHLFDIDVPGGITFKESAVLSPGNKLLTFEAGPCKVGIGICYDMRFPELAHLYDQKGCNLLIYPGAFNMTTGPAHWQSLITSRALDNQLYVGACSPARDESSTYVAWGHSTVIDPWGKIVAKADEKEDIIYATIDAERVESIRNQIPTHFQKRKDIYNIVNVVDK
eukprot:Seg3796.1 transcript_id=Seg3796.1/GoldUCD/mRNA.D3Y31 product="Omega-amidase NIT2" protein_id=Seg3796.1/GoldUCD/D3Y31